MNSTRRLILKTAFLSFVPGFAAAREGLKRPLLFGTTPVFLDEQTRFLNDWQRYFSARLAQPVRFIQRGRYREILELLLSGKLDFAWLCGFPYVRHKHRLRLLAVPLYGHAPLYRSYLITPAEDQKTRTILDLRGRIFAYSDPDSNSGWLTPQVELKRHGEEARRFFRKSFFTFSHRRVIEAVAAGLAQGGAVDGYIWDTLSRLHPEVTRATRVAWRSQTFGFPPVVAGPSLTAATGAAVREALHAMTVDSEGRRLLDQLNLTGFTAGNPALFDGIEANWRYLEG